MAEQIVKIEAKGDIIIARSRGRELAARLGFGSADQTRLATAISELARNALQYAGKGICRIIDESGRGRSAITVEIEDHGPGIPDADQAMEFGYSTGGGLGAGLPGAKRLVHDFQLSSEPGHTVVVIKMSRRRG